MLFIIIFNNFAYRFERFDVGVDKSIAGRIILVNENIGQIANPIKLKILKTAPDFSVCLDLCTLFKFSC